jgi:hypothetical protein
MSLAIVTLTYGLMVTLAIGLLYRFGALRWYWHALAIAAALTLGSLPMHVFGRWVFPNFDLVLGGGIVFLLVWGVAAPFFPRPHLRVHHR